MLPVTFSQPDRRQTSARKSAMIQSVTSFTNRPLVIVVPFHIRLWNRSTQLLRPPHFTSEFLVDEVRDTSLSVSDKLSLAVKFFGKQFAFSIVSGKQLVSLTSSFTQ